MTPGFCILHANRLEDLRALLVEWLREHPLAPLEQEIVLVQNRGMVQWLKLALAEPADAGGHGIAASLAPTLPARFLWDAYRAVLGAARVPHESPYDKDALTWRLLRQLPGPLKGELDGSDPLARYRMARRLADLFDQYQVYRADWLNDWARGGRTAAEAYPWQPELWRALLTDIGEDVSRAALHREFLAALEKADERPAGLPRRVVIFGISALPQQWIEALAALGRHCQVLLFVNNPCRHYWADIVEDRQFAGGSGQTRHAVKLNQNNPLLASWGKQGRDCIGMLYRYDEPDRYRGNFQQIDQFRSPLPESGAPTLLQRLQHSIFDLEKTLEGAERDPSIAFRTAHSAQREVEVLHDHLLALMEADPTLQPRDIVVMTPDIDAYAPHVDAVFGRLARDDVRFLPWSIADRRARVQDPLLRALDWLLMLPDSRIGLSEVLGLMDVAPIRDRFGLRPGDLAQVQEWLTGAGVRWGLHGEHRAALNLPGDYTRNTWTHGLDRMLLGYANGELGPWNDIDPYDEVGGLAAASAGPVAELIQAIDETWRVLRTPAPPEEWVSRLQALLERFVLARDADSVLMLGRLEDALEHWRAHCEAAGLTEPLPVEVVRDAWLGAVDETVRSPQFLYGRVNFCTLLPMRAIPFKVVCLLGMNDRKFPRPQAPQDFDLMAPQYRPGDRSRREDDRYQFLEAVLAAREHLYISWIGHQARDNAELSPSVLVSQLREFLGTKCSESLTEQHPLQPFSSRYFSSDSPLTTYAHEWSPDRARSTGPRPLAARPLAARPLAGSLAPRLPDFPLPLHHLVRFMRQPVKYFFEERLSVSEPRELEVAPDHEPFELDGLQQYGIAQTLLEAALREGRIDIAASRLERAGALPPGWLGAGLREQAEEKVDAVLERFRALDAQRAEALPVAISLDIGDKILEIEDIVQDIYRNQDLLRVRLLPSDLKGKPYRMIEPWVTHLALNASGHAVPTHVIAPDEGIIFPPIDRESARSMLVVISGAWKRGLSEPLRIATKTSLAWVTDPDSASATYEGGYHHDGERSESPFLARIWPDYESLTAHPEFEVLARTLYGPMLEAANGSA